MGRLPRSAWIGHGSDVEVALLAVLVYPYTTVMPSLAGFLGRFSLHVPRKVCLRSMAPFLNCVCKYLILVRNDL